MVILAAMAGCAAFGGAVGLWLGYLWGFDAGIRWVSHHTGVSFKP